jgi:hypothetical protein
MADAEADAIGEVLPVLFAERSRSRKARSRSLLAIAIDTTKRAVGSSGGKASEI